MEQKSIQQKAQALRVCRTLGRLNGLDRVTGEAERLDPEAQETRSQRLLIDRVKQAVIGQEGQPCPGSAHRCAPPPAFLEIPGLAPSLKT